MIVVLLNVSLPGGVRGRNGAFKLLMGPGMVRLWSSRDPAFSVDMVYLGRQFKRMAIQTAGVRVSTLKQHRNHLASSGLDPLSSHVKAGKVLQPAAGG